MEDAVSPRTNGGKDSMGVLRGLSHGNNTTEEGTTCASRVPRIPNGPKWSTQNRESNPTQRRANGLAALTAGGELSREDVAQGTSALRFASFMRGGQARAATESGSSDEEIEEESSSEAKRGVDDSMKGLSEFSSSAARAEATLSRQHAERLQLSAHYQRLRQGMRPPPPMTLAELETHPLRGRKGRALPSAESDGRCQAHVDGSSSAGAQDSQFTSNKRPYLISLSEAHLETFTPRTRDVEVKRYLMHELSSAEALANEQKVVRSKKPNRGDSLVSATRRPKRAAELQRLEIRIPAPPNHGPHRKSHEQRGSEHDESVSETFFVTDVCLPTDTPQSSRSSARKGIPNNSPSKRAFMVPPAGTTPMMRDVARSSPRSTASREPLEEGLCREPSSFNDTDRDYRHAQHYRRVAAAKAGPTPSPAVARDAMDAASSDDVKDFFFSLANRSGKFNEAAVSELRRVREAQRVFFQAKREAIDSMLDDPRFAAVPAEKLLSQARRSMSLTALRKDNAERLDVYFEHLDRLERYSSPKFFGESKDLLSKFLAQVRADVGASDASLGVDGFVQAWRHFKGLFGYESLLELHTVEMLKILSAMYGVEKSQFDLWVQKKLRRYDPRDYNTIFRTEDNRSGKELPSKRVRVTILNGRNLLPNDGAVYRQVGVKLLSESGCLSTPLKPLTSTRVCWDKQFLVGPLDDETSIRFQVVVDEVTQGEGSVQLSSLQASGSPLSVQLPVCGPAIPHARLDLEISLVYSKEVVAYMAPTLSTTHITPLHDQSPLKKVAASTLGAGMVTTKLRRGENPSPRRFQSELEGVVHPNSRGRAVHASPAQDLGDDEGV